jgi:hypothetical protein
MQSVPRLIRPSLDEPLHLLILTSLADNLSAASDTLTNSGVNILTDGLPETQGTDAADPEDWVGLSSSTRDGMLMRNLDRVRD